jgi:hypoxanthine-guanine phosphoribosyltransferase
MLADLERVLFDEVTILRRLDEMAAQISSDYRDRELTVIVILMLLGATFSCSTTSSTVASPSLPFAKSYKRQIRAAFVCAFYCAN